MLVLRLTLFLGQPHHDFSQLDQAGTGQAGLGLGFMLNSQRCVSFGVIQNIPKEGCIF